MNSNERRDLITADVVKETGRVLTEVQCIRRWSSYISDARYNELNKQALNAMITYVLAAEAQHAGKEIDMTKFPKIFMHRVFEKLFLCDIREDYVDHILKIGNIDRKRFDEVIEQRIEEEMGTEFAQFINISKDSLEVKIFQGAMKLATRMELSEIRPQVTLEADYHETLRNIEQHLDEYNDLPGFSRISLEYSKEMTLFRQISALRNRIRWSKRLISVKCAVLGHNFEVATFAYMMALAESGDEEVATKAFFTGLFHDVPETFTGDMPKPVKDAIPGLRKATEFFELEMVNKHIYANLPGYVGEAMHNVMLEELDGDSCRDIVKKADVMSACLECVRNIIAGSKDSYFTHVVDRDLHAKIFDGVFQEALEDISKNKSF